jgi:hypothetical protein
MSKSLRAIICGTVLALACTVAGLQGCGGDGGGGGGGGSSGAAGSSGGAWSCMEVTNGCACVPTASTLPSTCTGTYSCCYKTMSGTTLAGCSCIAGLAANDCALFISSLNGGGISATATAKCP